MKQARRLYGKKQQNPNKKLSSANATFCSKVNRTINHPVDNSLGPGEYNISLPIVKPNYQTIQKNSNTVIIKFNNNISSIFKSKSPRFKQIEINQLQNNQINKQTNIFRPYHQQRKYLPILKTIEQENQQNDRPFNKMFYQQQQVRQHKQKSQSPRKVLQKQYQKQKLLQNHIISQQKQRLQNHTISAQRQMLQNHMISEQNQKPLQRYCRLHHKQVFLKQKTISQNRYNNIKSTVWSKYKQPRKSFNVLNGQQFPGPGSYQLKQLKVKSYKNRMEPTSWQFNSNTQRNTFNNNSLNLRQQLEKQKKQKFKQYLFGDNTNVEQQKKLYLMRKRSHQSISNFHLASNQKEEFKRIDHKFGINIQIHQNNQQQNV